MKTILKNDPKCIKLLFEVEDRIPSVNQLYLVNRKTGGLYRNPKATKVYQEVQKQITLSGIIDYMPKFMEGHRWYKTSYQFIVRFGLDTRDLSNMLKLVEDAIHRKLGIDDSAVVEIDCVKSQFNAWHHNEFIVFQIEPSDFDPMFFEKSDKSE
jgi:Holliday junction resolvase RusA-like endonuclease